MKKGLDRTFLNYGIREDDMMLIESACQSEGIDEWLHFSPLRGGKSLMDIPELNLYIGQYEDGMDACLDINNTAIPNTQILVTGTTGSGKSNLLSVLISQIRMASADTYYPVNFLLFDYKGEYSDPSHADWLTKFETDSSAILNPMEKPLPFTPFKDFTGRPVNEINLYSTSLASAISAISGATIGTLMDNHIINLGKFDKDGIMAKAIVYFVTSKLNNIYEELPPQATNAERVELRHFTVIDEAHYMLGFKNKPLQNLIAVGRNKGMSVILATQNMDSFKSKHFDFYANAQYPLIMKQQQQNNGVLKDLFGVSGIALQELKQAIAALQKGELTTKDNKAIALGLGKHWKKIKVTRF